MQELILDPTLTIPVVEGAVMAGRPDGMAAGMGMPQSLADIFGCSGQRLYKVRVEGRSMEGASIYDGDWAFVDPDCLPQNGDIVVARFEQGYTIKYLWRDERQHCVWLLPDNPEFPPLCYEADQELTIVGVYVNPCHRPRVLTRERFEQILSHSPAPRHYGRQRRDVIDQAVSTLLHSTATTGGPLMRYRKDWVVPFRLLAEQGDFLTNEYTGFCSFLAGLPSFAASGHDLPSASSVGKVAAGFSGRYPDWHQPYDMSDRDFSRMLEIARCFVGAME